MRKRKSRPMPSLSRVATRIINTYYEYDGFEKIDFLACPGHPLLVHTWCTLKLLIVWRKPPLVLTRSITRNPARYLTRLVETSVSDATARIRFAKRYRRPRLFRQTPGRARKLASWTCTIVCALSFPGVCLYVTDTSIRIRVIHSVVR